MQTLERDPAAWTVQWRRSDAADDDPAAWTELAKETEVTFARRHDVRTFAVSPTSVDSAGGGVYKIVFSQTIAGDTNGAAGVFVHAA